MARISVSIIIVHYGDAAHITKCLASIPKEENIEVVVVSNTNNNRGFAKGCNRGNLEAKGEFLLFLNPDTSVNYDSIKLMLNEFEDENVGMVGPLLVDEKGNKVLSCSKLPTAISAPLVYSFLNKILLKNKIIQEHWYGFKPPTKKMEVGVISGAAIMMRKSVFEALGGFDEKFFMYWEEMDLCKRLIDLKKKVVFLPSAKFMHVGAGVSILPKGITFGWFRDSRFIFFKKHYGLTKALLLEAWFAFSEEWRLLLSVLMIMTAGFWFFLNGWFLDIPIGGVEIFPFSVVTTYFMGLFGLLIMSYGLHDLFYTSSQVFKMVVGLTVPFLSFLSLPFAAIVHITGGLLWILADLTGRRQLRKNLTVLWVGASIIWSIMILGTKGFPWERVSYWQWYQIADMIKMRAGDREFSISCYGCGNQQLLLTQALKDKGLKTSDMSSLRLVVLLPPFNANARDFVDTIQFQIGDAAILWPLQVPYPSP